MPFYEKLVLYVHEKKFGGDAALPLVLLGHYTGERLQRSL